MLPSLLYREPRPRPPKVVRNARDLRADLGLDAVIGAMARGDACRADAAHKLLFESPAIPAGDIHYRQSALMDALSNAKDVLSLYDALGSGLDAYDDAYRKSQPGYARFAPLVERLRASTGMMSMLLALAKDVGQRLKHAASAFTSDAFRSYAQEFCAFYDEAFLCEARKRRDVLAEVSEGSRLILGAGIGNGLKGASYVLRAVEPPQKKPHKPGKAAALIPLDKIAHQQKAMELRDAALTKALYLSNAVNERVAGELKALRFELGFYTGCMLLNERCAQLNAALCFPTPDEGKGALRFDGLVDVGMLLRNGKIPVGNALDLNGKRLAVITGANQGGKSTFLRSVGCAQLMMQCGLFVAAGSFASSVCPGVFTHFCRAEDAGMDSGKLDEELRRMSGAVSALRPGAMLLMNESFASTTEREGAAVALEITRALCSAGIRVLFVTHFYDYARLMQESETADAVLLRAQRLDGGARTFLIQPGISLPTSHGLDLFACIVTDSQNESI